MLLKSVTDDPQTQKCRFASVGQRSTTAPASSGSAERKAETAVAYCIADGGSTESGMNPTISNPSAARPIIAGIKLLSAAACSAAAMADCTAAGTTFKLTIMAL